MIRELVRVITVAIVAAIPGAMAPAYVAPAEATARSPAYENAAVLAGNGLSYGYAIAVHESGDVFIAGKARDIAWPVKPRIFGSALSSSHYYAYIARLDPGLSAISAVAILNGSGDDAIQGIEFDGDGNILALGETFSPDFAGVAGKKEPHHGKTDVFVVRLTAGLDELLALKVLGGDDYDYGRAMRLTPSGEIYVTGVTGSRNFPTTAGAFKTKLHEPRTTDRISYGLDVFITKLSPALDRIIASTLYGKIDDQHVYGLALDEKRNVYITGSSFREGVTLTPGVDNAGDKKGLLDLFIAKFDENLTHLLAGTSWGGASQEYTRGIQVKKGFVYLSGYSRSGDFPWTRNALQRGRKGDVYDSFVVKIRDDLKEIVYSSMIGGAGLDFNRGLLVAPAGELVLFGNSNSGTSFPGARILPDGSGEVRGYDFYAAVLDPDFKPVSTFFIGGQGREQLFDLRLARGGDMYAIGTTTSASIDNARLLSGPVRPGVLNVLVVRLRIFGGAE